jgi:hypothetical protein
MYFSSINRLAYDVKQNPLNYYQTREFSFKYSAAFYLSFSLAGLFLSFLVEDEDTSPCRIKDVFL